MIRIKKYLDFKEFWENRRRNKNFIDKRNNIIKLNNN